MQKSIIPHLYLLFGIIIFLLSEGIFQTAGFFGYLSFYGSIIMVAISFIVIIMNNKRS